MDTTLRLVDRAAAASQDVSATVRLVQARARLGQWDAAAQAALLGGPALDTAEALDPLTPDLDELVVERPELEVLPLDLRWTPEGTGVYGLVDTERRGGRVGLQLQVQEVSFATRAARVLVASEPEHHICYGASPIMHPGGAYVTFAAMDDLRRRYLLFSADRTSGELSDPIGRVSTELEELALTASGVLTVRGARRLRFLQLSPSGAGLTSRAFLTLDASAAVLAADGSAFAVLPRRRRWPRNHAVECRDAGSDALRASIPGGRHERVSCAGRRVVLADRQRIRLHGPSGELLADVPVPVDFYLWEPVPSPSGRLVAFPRVGKDGEGRLLLVDLRTGRSRTFAGPPLAGGREAPLQCRWSPSGRKLLVGCTGQTCVLLVAP